MAWQLAKALERLRAQINAVSPSRSKVSDGSIGDEAHASRNSDHNPWIKQGSVGIVSAIDVTHDPANGVDGAILSRSLIADPRVKYVIFARQIWKARTGQWEPYVRKPGQKSYNPHDHHVHISIQPEAIDDISSWPWPTTSAPSVKPVLKTGSSGQDVRVLQDQLRARGADVSTDGNFGPKTEAAVRRFQEQQGLTVDGIVNAATWAKLA